MIFMICRSVAWTRTFNKGMMSYVEIPSLLLECRAYEENLCRISDSLLHKANHLDFQVAKKCYMKVEAWGCWLRVELGRQTTSNPLRIID